MADDEDDDPQLRSLRAVWLALPDEEPPTRGLDALMAAARTKAAEMAEPAPTFWQRLAALFRRPPVLALVTVVLLVGGGLIVSQSQKSATAPAPDTTRETTPAAPATESLRAPASNVAGEGAAPPAPDPVAVPTPATAPATAPATGSAPARGDSAPHHATSTSRTTSTTSGFTATKSKASAGKAKADADLPFSDDALELASPRPTDPAAAARAAAARGDCRTARTLASKLSSPNASNDAALARCLAAQQ